MKKTPQQTGRVLSAILSCVTAVLVAGAVAAASPLAYTGFNSGEDSPAYTLGELHGQGSATGGWASAWVSSTTTTGVFNVVEGGCPAQGPCPGDPDQRLAMYGAISSSYHVDRMMDPWSGDFRFDFCLRLSDSADGQRDQTQIVFKNAAGQRPLHIKIGASNYAMFIVNEQPMIVQSGDALHPDMVPLGTSAENWAHLAIVCDWDTATFDLYWEQTDGSMKLVNTKVGWRDSTYTGDVTKMEIWAPKAYGNINAGMDIDAISFVPEPAAIILLGLGGLAMLRRRR